MSKKSKKASVVDKSQEPLDYSVIEKLRQEAWSRPQVQKNWREFHRREAQEKKRKK